MSKILNNSVWSTVSRCDYCGALSEFYEDDVKYFQESFCPHEWKVWVECENCKKHFGINKPFIPRSVAERFRNKKWGSYSFGY